MDLSIAIIQLGDMECIEKVFHPQVFLGLHAILQESVRMILFLLLLSQILFENRDELIWMIW